MLKWIGAVIGILALLLGGLWFLQGTGLVVIDPIACVGECAALTGPSLPWALAVFGAALIWFSLRRRR